MERDLVLEPVPQDLEQDPYDDQSETTQSRAQEKVLQEVDADKLGQTAPPFATSVMMERDFVFDPVPQVLEQDS
jgi:hypothetical protein